jgi:hypothetical protein
MKTTLCFAMILMATGIAVRAQDSATEYVLSIGSGDVTTYNALGVEGSKCYKLAFQVPEGVAANALESAVLEFFVDVAPVTQGDFQWFDADSVEHVGYTAPTPLLEVYALKSPIDGTIRDGQLEKSTMACTPVLVGENRRVVIDITSIVRSFAIDSGRNFGIVVGSFTGLREGDFTIRESAFQDGSRARVHIANSLIRPRPE